MLEIYEGDIDNPNWLSRGLITSFILFGTQRKCFLDLILSHNSLCQKSRMICGINYIAILIFFFIYFITKFQGRNIARLDHDIVTHTNPRLYSILSPNTQNTKWRTQFFFLFIFLVLLLLGSDKCLITALKLNILNGTRQWQSWPSHDARI